MDLLLPLFPKNSLLIMLCSNGTFSRDLLITTKEIHQLKIYQSQAFIYHLLKPKYFIQHHPYLQIITPLNIKAYFNSLIDIT